MLVNVQLDENVNEKQCNNYYVSFKSAKNKQQLYSTICFLRRVELSVLLSL